VVYETPKSNSIDYHPFALRVVRAVAWLCAFSAVVYPLYALLSDGPESTAYRLGFGFAWAFAGAFWWGVLVLFVRAVEQLHELHFELFKKPQ
jgi:hypothetical protein